MLKGNILTYLLKERSTMYVLICVACCAINIPSAQVLSLRPNVVTSLVSRYKTYKKLLSVLIVVMPCLFHEAGAIEKLTILVAMPQRNLPWQVSTHYSISQIRFLYAYSNIPFILQMSLGTIANFFTSSITHFLESTS